MPVKKRPVTKSGIPRKRKGVKLVPTTLNADELLVEHQAPEEETFARQVEADGGSVLATYKEPLGGHTQFFVALPIDKVEPTPFQRDVSDSHLRKLTVAMDRTRRYLDPIIVVRKDGGYFTPNGNHRLTALKELGAKTILALLIPEERVGYQILSLNIEKAHNLREKSLEVARMYDELSKLDASARETDYSLEFEEAQFITLGLTYQQRGRFSGGAYQPVLKRVDSFLNEPFSKAMTERRQRAQTLLELDDAVADSVAKLKARGLESPYLKAFVVARINPLRFIKGEAPSYNEVLETMIGRARKIDPAKITSADLSRSGGAADDD
jgi:ParB family transcriptional regulator, chromosome partitioning protein